MHGSYATHAILHMVSNGRWGGRGKSPVEILDANQLKIKEVWIEKKQWNLQGGTFRMGVCPVCSNMAADCTSNCHGAAAATMTFRPCPPLNTHETTTHKHLPWECHCTPSLVMTHDLQCANMHTQHRIAAFFLCLCGLDLLFVSLCGCASCPGCEPTSTSSYCHPESAAEHDEMKFHSWYLCDHNPTTSTWTLEKEHF